MQIATTSIKIRTRYYHSQLDMDLLKTGHSYEELPETYVIFICDYDPFGDGKYCYTVQQILKENGTNYDDGRHSVFLSTTGTNQELPGCFPGNVGKCEALRRFYNPGKRFYNA